MWSVYFLNIITSFFLIFITSRSILISVGFSCDCDWLPLYDYPTYLGDCRLIIQLHPLSRTASLISCLRSQCKTTSVNVLPVSSPVGVNQSGEPSSCNIKILGESKSSFKIKGNSKCLSYFQPSFSSKYD